jgi:hypothetical protein
MPLKIKIWGRYQGSVEEIDTAETWQEARYLLNEYRTAFGPGWNLWAGSRRDG